MCHYVLLRFEEGFEIIILLIVMVGLVMVWISYLYVLSLLEKHLGPVPAADANPPTNTPRM